MCSDPLAEAFRKQKNRAKGRRVEWKLAYWEWLQIWQDSGHLPDRGTHKGQWCMARRGDQGAYETGNVSIVRVETNNEAAGR
jgi:hypothetical protein